MSPNAYILLCKMLVVDPGRRASAEEIREYLMPSSGTTDNPIAPNNADKQRILSAFEKHLRVRGASLMKPSNQP